MARPVSVERGADATHPQGLSAIGVSVSRLFKKAVQQGRSERGGDAYSVPYVEPQSDARTPLADFFNSLLAGGFQARRGLVQQRRELFAVEIVDPDVAGRNRIDPSMEIDFSFP